MAIRHPRPLPWLTSLRAAIAARASLGTPLSEASSGESSAGSPAQPSVSLLWQWDFAAARAGNWAPLRAALNGRRPLPLAKGISSKKIRQGFFLIDECAWALAQGESPGLSGADCEALAALAACGGNYGEGFPLGVWAKHLAGTRGSAFFEEISFHPVAASLRRQLNRDASAEELFLPVDQGLDNPWRLLVFIALNDPASFNAIIDGLESTDTVELYLAERGHPKKVPFLLWDAFARQVFTSISAGLIAGEAARDLWSLAIAMDLDSPRGAVRQAIHNLFLMFDRKAEPVPGGVIGRAHRIWRSTEESVRSPIPFDHPQWIAWRERAAMMDELDLRAPVEIESAPNPNASAKDNDFIIEPPEASEAKGLAGDGDFDDSEEGEAGAKDGKTKGRFAKKRPLRL